MNDDELLYSPEASATRYFYYQGLNSINIFVEDEGKEYEYETIFRNMFGDQFNIATIFAAGGKQQLIKRFYEFGETDRTNTSIKNFYLADGDFDRYICPFDIINNNQFI